MNWLRQLRASQRPGAFGAIATMLLGLLFLFPPLGNLPRNLSYDLAFLFRPGADVSDVVVVSMDEHSHGQLAQTPGVEWHRLLHARMIDELHRQGARAVVFDVLIVDPWANKSVSANASAMLTNRFGFTPADLAPDAVDRILSRAIANAREGGLPVVWGSITDPAGRGVKVNAPDRILGTNVLFGNVQFPDLPGRTFRRHNADTAPPSLAWVAADALGQAPKAGVPNRWINYYGPRRTFHYLPYATVLEDANTQAALTNRVVFVGREPVIGGDGRTDRDEHPTPYTLWKRTETPGVEIQATAFLNLYRDEWLELSPPWLQCVWVVVFGGLAGAGLARMRPWIAARVAFGGMVLCAAAGIGVTWTTGHWFPWVTVAGVQLPVALAWSVFANTKRVYREKAVLEESLATAHSRQAPGSTTITSRPTAVPIPLRRIPVSGDPAPPDIPDHAMVRRIGRGAYGEVWLARDIIGTYHAVKVVHRSAFSSEAPYLREFRGIQKFTPISRQHPGLVQVLHVGRNEPAGYFYCIMEIGDDARTGQDIHPDTYVPLTLSHQLDQRRYLPAAACIDLGIALAEALEFLHQRRLIHRDIKPSNILYVQGAPKFADVGLVTDLVTGSGREATYLGTEGFIAPEGPGTAAADVFSLGKLLYEAGMGRDRQRFPELPTDLEEMPDQELLLELNPIILKACEADVTERYQNAADLARDLKALKQKM